MPSLPGEGGSHGLTKTAIDLNLLTALDVLLAERSVTRAAGRLAGRLPVLVREARAVLTPAAADPDPASLARTFTIHANEGFVSLFAAAIVAAITQEAPLVRLRFAPKPDKDARPLREGPIDIEVGTTGASAPEMRSQMIFRDRFIAAARHGHPVFDGVMTSQRYAACGHVVASRRGAMTGPVDEALREIGLERRIVAVVPGFLDALTVARRSDLVALVPQSCLLHGQVAHGQGAHGQGAAEGLQGVDLPVTTPELAISLMWHPRLDADPAHRWFRQTLMAVCRKMT
jgi:DNA-binding transcriptional LysR family regulator